MKFEWDPHKSVINFRKHRVTFHEAASVFSDSLAISFVDPDHSEDEPRELTFGLAVNKKLLVVSHTDRNGTIRIISARLMTRNEQKIYEEG